MTLWDVPAVDQVTEPRYFGLYRIAGQIPYHIFDNENDAVRWVNGRNYLINHRKWDADIFAASLIVDHRKCLNETDN